MLTGQTIGNLELLRCREEAEILSPSKVNIFEGVLGWGVDFTWGGECIDRRCFLATPVEDVLSEFLGLADGDGSRLIDFVQRRGVLGIFPHVTCPEWDAHAETFTLYYQEPIGVYTRLACVARNLLDVFQAIKDRTPITRNLLFDAEFGVGREVQARGQQDTGQREAPAFDSIPMERAYTEVLMLAEKWCKASDFRLALSGLEVIPMDDGPGPLGSGLTRSILSPTQSPDFILKWGNWHDGAQWDARQAGRLFLGDWHGGDWGPPPWELEANSGMWSPSVPSDRQRPSALFNALTFQLMKRLAMPVGTHWCIQCGGSYTLDEKFKQLQLAESRGERRNVQYPRKPRKDTGSFCSPDCEDERLRGQFRESKRRAVKGETKKRDK